MAFDPTATYDAQWRKQPKRMFGAIETFRALPWLFSAFDKEVPATYWQKEGESIAHEAKVNCLCGTEVTVPFNRLTDCETAGCGRWFFFDGTTVRAARDVSQQPSTDNR